MFEILFQLNPHSYPPLLIGTGVLMLGFFVWFKNIKAKHNIVFFLFSLFVGIWMWTYSVTYSVEDPNIALILMKIGYSLTMFFATFAFHFIVLFLNLGKKFNKFLIFIYAIAFSFAVINFFTPLLMKDVLFKYFWGYYPDITTSLGSLPVIFTTIQITVILILIWREAILKRKEIPADYFNKIKFIVFGLIIFCFLALDYIPGYGIEMYPFGFIFVLAFLVSTAYGIFRYQAMEIETVFHKTLLWSILLLLTVLPIFGVYFLLGDWIKERDLLSLTLFSAALVFIFSWYKDKIKPYIDNFFRRRAYDYYNTLLESIEEVSKTVNPQEAIEKFINNIKNTLYPQNAFILIKKEAGYISKDEDIKVNLSTKNYLYSFIEERRFPIQKEQFKSNLAQKIPEETIRWFEDNKIEVLVPLMLQDEIIGLLALGKKENLKSYTLKDLYLLWKIGKMAGIAFLNLFHYEELVGGYEDLIKEEHVQKTKLEDVVLERTKDLKKRLEDLERFRKVTIGRELRMIEMKKEIEGLKRQLGEKD